MDPKAVFKGAESLKEVMAKAKQEAERDIDERIGRYIDMPRNMILSKSMSYATQMWGVIFAEACKYFVAYCAFMITNILLLLPTSRQAKIRLVRNTPDFPYVLEKINWLIDARRDRRKKKMLMQMLDTAMEMGEVMAIDLKEHRKPDGSICICGECGDSEPDSSGESVINTMRRSFSSQEGEDKKAE